jgi:hypothetical protein
MSDNRFPAVNGNCKGRMTDRRFEVTHCQSPHTESADAQGSPSSLSANVRSDDRSGEFSKRPLRHRLPSCTRSGKDTEKVAEHRMGVLTWVVGCLLLAGSLGWAVRAAAQCASEIPNGIKSNGIQGSVESAIPLQGSTLALTLKLDNLTRNVAYVLAVGNYSMSSNTGAQLHNAGRVVGINYCSHVLNDAQNLRVCKEREAQNIDSYKEIGPCQSIRVSMYFAMSGGPDIKSGNTVDYSFQGLVRYQPETDDPLKADMPLSPIRNVTLNFPPIAVR